VTREILKAPYLSRSCGETLKMSAKYKFIICTATNKSPTSQQVVEI
jgi:hypothetical protein